MDEADDRRVGMTPAEYAAYWGVNVRTVHKWIRQGKLGALRVSDRITRIPVDEARRFEEAARMRPRAVRGRSRGN